MNMHLAGVEQISSRTKLKMGRTQEERKEEYREAT